MMLEEIFLGMPFIAERPYLMHLFSTVKFSPLLFTLGDRSLIPKREHSEAYSAILERSSETLESKALKN